MKLFLISYMVLINLLALALMGIDKWKARRGRWRISEKTLFLAAIFGGSIGSLAGMYLFRHKTKHLRFTIGIPVILVLQMVGLAFFFHCRHSRIPAPSAAVEQELELIRKLDETAITSFVSYENMMRSPSGSPEAGPETTEAVKLFFQNFDFHLRSEEITDDTATVTVEIINIDTKALAKDLCRALTLRSLNLPSGESVSLSSDDYYALLRDTLESHDYELTATTAAFHLKLENRVWVIQADETLQDQLVGGFVSWIQDPYLLTPQETAQIYLDAFSSLSAEEWLEYLNTQDIFSTYSPSYSEEVDLAYAEKLAEFFSGTAGEGEIRGDQALVPLTITTLDMNSLLESYRERLLGYARTSESITSSDTELADDTARHLLDTFREDASTVEIPVTAALINDGHAWQLQITQEITDAFLGNIDGAIENFQTAS